MTREDKSIENRRALVSAAAEIVGEFGYRDASIARITQRAGLAQGTFYLYFQSRQDLFDELLPTLGNEMLQFLAIKVRGAADVLDVEERGFRGFFEFARDNPAFFRILNEAEVAAPIAYDKHFSLLRERYVESLGRSAKKGELPDFNADELEVVAYVLMAARSYLYLRYAKDENGPKELPDWVAKAFMKFVSGGFLQGRTGPRAKSAADATPAKSRSRKATAGL